MFALSAWFPALLALFSAACCAYNKRKRCAACAQLQVQAGASSSFQLPAPTIDHRPSSSSSSQVIVGQPPVRLPRSRILGWYSARFVIIVDLVRRVGGERGAVRITYLAIAQWLRQVAERVITATAHAQEWRQHIPSTYTEHSERAAVRGTCTDPDSPLPSLSPSLPSKNCAA